MKILTADQGSPEWFDARSGHFTASEIDAVFSAPGTKRRHDLIMQMVFDMEGIERFQDEEKPWFRDGKVFEDRGRAWYEFTFDTDVEQIGFVEADPPFQFIGCSPDGLVGDDGSIEIKHRSTLKSYKSAVGLQSSGRQRSRTLQRSYMTQVQTLMFVCDRKWTDFIDFWCDAEMDVRKGSVKRIERDDAFIDKLLLAASHAYREAAAIFKNRKQGQQ